MKILFLVPYTPSPIRTRPYNLLRSLNKMGHVITLATLWENSSEQETLEKLKAEGIRVIARPLSRMQKAINLLLGVMSSQPIQAWYCWHSGLAQDIVDALYGDRYDIVHVEHLRGVRYALHIQSQTPDKVVPLVWDAVDCITMLFEQAVHQSKSSFGRWVTRFELPRTRAFEASLPSKFLGVLVTSPLDREAFLGLEKGTNIGEKIYVLRNGVDLAYFCPDGSPRSGDTIVFTGKLSYHANITAAHFLSTEVMPRVWAKRSETVLQIVGKDPPASLSRLAEQDHRIRVIGNVPDMRPYLRQAAVAAAPILYGAGIQNKVLEAMACGTPVVATQKAISALEHLCPGKDILIGNTADELALAILDLLADGQSREQIGRAGLAYVRQWHDWDRIASILEERYQELTATISEFHRQPFRLANNRLPTDQGIDIDETTRISNG